MCLALRSSAFPRAVSVPASELNRRAGAACGSSDWSGLPPTTQPVMATSADTCFISEGLMSLKSVPLPEANVDFGLLRYSCWGQSVSALAMALINSVCNHSVDAALSTTSEAV